MLACAGIILLALGCCSAEEGGIDMTGTPQVETGVNTGHSPQTDIDTHKRENESMSSAAAQRRAREGAEQFVFQAEVTRLMDIIINSLYSNKDIFLRELISNASDALDKIRFLALTDKSQLGEGETSQLEIRISLDKANNVLLIRDRGVGMTKADLISNLGTIAKSGTSAFLETMQKGGDMNLIGQFGVGFYSVYLVADWVEVVTKHNDDKQYIWSSNAGGSFTIAEDTENEPLGRGTLIKIHLKPEAQEYAEEAKLRELVSKYSEFINFPIHLLATKEVEVPIEEEAEQDAAAAGEDGTTEDGDVDDDDVEDEQEDDPSQPSTPKAPATRKEQRQEWEVLNDAKAIWLRPPGDVEDEEYQAFYKAVSKDVSGEALAWTHFKAEGDVEFKSILMIPKTAPPQYYERYHDKTVAGLKLYVRRVFISGDFAELLPRYLAFLRGLVDSDSLPINVSREMLQAHSSLKTIKKKLVRKALDLIKRLADDENKCKADAKEGGEDADDVDEEACGKYGQFWTQYSRAVKLGLIEDPTNRGRLTRLLRFHTNKSGDKITSLEEYVSRMKDGQPAIYFVTGSSKEEVAASPFLERLTSKGYEVIYFTDVLDEYLMQHLTEFDDKKFSDASKEDLKLSDKDDGEKARDKDLKRQFKKLTKWWKEQVGNKVSSVKVSNRLSTTPCVVVTPKWAQSANMERIMRAQALGDPSKMAMMRGQRTLEINPRHPLIKALRDRVANDPADEANVDVAKLLLDTALLESGFNLDDVKDYTKRMYSLLKANIGMDGSLDAIEPEQEDTPSTDAAASAAGGKPAASREEDADDDVEDDVKDEL